MIHPYRCPQGHAAVELGVRRAQCETCRLNNLRANFDKSEIVDLRKVDYRASDLPLSD